MQLYTDDTKTSPVTFLKCSNNYYLLYNVVLLWYTFLSAGKGMGEVWDTALVFPLLPSMKMIILAIVTLYFCKVLKLEPYTSVSADYQCQ